MKKREQEKYSESREERDEELEENYKKVVNHIDDIDDENARDKQLIRIQTVEGSSHLA